MDLKAEAKRASEMLKARSLPVLRVIVPTRFAWSLRMEAESMLTENLKAKALSYLSQELKTTPGQRICLKP